MKKAFTMMELIFVVVIIGILAAVALPRFSLTSQDASDTAVLSTVSAIQSGIQLLKSKRAINQNYDPFYLDNALLNTQNQNLFGYENILQSPVVSSNATGGWMKTGHNSDTNDSNYTYNHTSGIVRFEYTARNGKFECKDNDAVCKQITQSKF